MGKGDGGGPSSEAILFGKQSRSSPITVWLWVSFGDGHSAVRTARKVKNGAGGLWTVDTNEMVETYRRRVAYAYDDLIRSGPWSSVSRYKCGTCEG